ncbi:holin family protein [Rhodobacteraceae bacterium B1Z28]|uniref:Holin family protein n=1 Tax=Ruegeria haliotis TaxID=2747601 RepID=A0ABX2PN94_9RHOB|nr:holin family protein [Ruegeria haliotis]NVO55141.1 holin family protein [Ruegeria haliotis]
MGLISGVLAMLFGGGRNVVRETAEVFRENADANAKRGVTIQSQAMTQFGAEFQVPRKGGFDRFMDGLNRLPRPALALGTLGLFVAAMVDPLWFAARMQGIALVPEPLWWLLGVVVSFYFGARHQAKMQDLQRDITTTMLHVPTVMANIEALRQMRSDSPGAADTGSDAQLAMDVTHPDANPALEDWRRLRQA